MVEFNPRFGKQTIVGVPLTNYSQTAKADPTFGENFLAQLGYTYAPLYGAVEEELRFGNLKREKTGFELEELSGYEDHIDYLVRAKNNEHLEYLKAQIDENRKRRDVIGRSNWYAPSSLIAGIVDPLNITFALPVFGQLGMLVRGGMTIGQAAKAGLKGGAVYAGASEAVRAPFDELNTFGESSINAISAIGLGTALGVAPNAFRALMPNLRKSSDNLQAMAQGEKRVDVENLGKEIKDGEVSEDLVKTFYTKYLMHLVPSAGKRIAKNGTQLMKNYYDRINGHAVLAKEKDLMGVGSNQSILQREGSYTVDANTFVNDFKVFYTRAITGDPDRKAPTQFMDFNIDSAKARIGQTFGGETPTFEEFFSQSFKKYVLSKDPKNQRLVKNLTDDEKQMHTKFKEYFDIFKENAQSVSLLKDTASLQKEIKILKNSLNDLETRTKYLQGLDDAKGLTAKQRTELVGQDAKQFEVTKKLRWAEDTLEEGIYNKFIVPIYYNKKLLKTDENAREGLTKIFERHLTRNPARVWDDEAQQYTQRLVQNPRQFAEETVASILEENADSIENFINKPGSGKHLKHRVLNIPEYEIIDYIITGPEVMYSYSNRMGKRIEWARNFGDKNIDDVLNEIEVDMRNKNFSEKKIASLKRDFSEEIRRATGQVIDDPDTLNNQTAQILRTMSGTTFLHGAGLAAVGDLGVTIIERGFKQLGVPIVNQRDRAMFKANAADAKYMIDNIDLSTALMKNRMIEDSVKRIQPSGTERVLNIVNQTFYNIPIVGNNLGMLTKYMKIMDGGFRASELIKYAVKIKNNTATNFDVQFMSRYGYSIDDAKILADMPWEKGDSMYYANTGAWKKSTPAEREILRRFQTALDTGVSNVILHATSFDKPMLVNGVFYMRHRPWMKGVKNPFTGAEFFPIDKRASTKNIGYVRFENQLLGLPFQFMNFGMGAFTRITGGMFDVARRHRLAGAMAMMFLGYSVLHIRNRNRAYFFEKEPTDLLARTIDQSGILGVYSDIFYMSLHGMMGSGIMNDSEYLRGKYKPDAIDALVEPFGASIGQMTDFGRVIYDYMNGNDNEASRRLARNIPWLQLYGMNDDFKDLLRSRN
ncbi:hypothetical protein [uncultured Mediterranean phage uvMED]|nr:hypothetical protein [uncultured Mediterranean phage uvMED]